MAVLRTSGAILAMILAILVGLGIGALLSSAFAQEVSPLNGPPSPAIAAPPSVADAGATGNIFRYAMENHTHASKARKGRVLVSVSGVYDVTFAAPMGSAPLCAVTAEATSGDTNVVNAQVDGVTTATGLRIRITRTAQSVVALLGLTILSVPTQVATYAHYICIEP